MKGVEKTDNWQRKDKETEPDFKFIIHFENSDWEQTQDFRYGSQMLTTLRWILNAAQYKIQCKLNL